MPEVDRHPLQAVAHPLRARILAVLDCGEPVPLRALAQALAESTRTVSRHVATLERLGLVTKTDGVRGPLYEISRLPYFSDEDFAAIPMPVRQACISTSLAQIHGTAAAAVANGGWDRDEIHLSRTALRLDEAGWQKAAAGVARLMGSLLVMQDEADQRLAGSGSEPAVHANAILMLYETPRSHRGDVEPDGLGPFTEAEGRQRAWELVEQLSQVLARTDADVSTAIAWVDELRVVLRATAATVPAPEEQAGTSE